MIRSFATLICLATLAACGADSAPQPPATVAISGSAQAGVVTKVN